MKAVILAGGFGTRISEETDTKPKPMVEIGGRPILWHIMKIYSAQGINDFIVCLGYKGYVIKEYFANYFLHMSNVMFDMENNEMTVLHKAAEPWRVTLVDTGESSHTGARIKRAAPYIDEDTFCLTYGDGVGDVDIQSAIETHRRQGRLATVTAVRPPGRFGNLLFEGDKVSRFQEKPEGDGGWINGGFFVLQRGVIDYIGDEESVIWEREPMERLARDGELVGYFHEGFWQPMDTLRDKQFLEGLWTRGEAPWKIWD
jgi:glucose-1-phosphate cytidylyltransferase